MLAIIGVAWFIWLMFLGGMDADADNYLRLHGIDPDTLPTREEVLAWERETNCGADGQDFTTWCNIRRTVENYEMRHGVRPDPLPTEDDVRDWEHETNYGADGQDFDLWWSAHRGGALTGADTV